MAYTYKFILEIGGATIKALTKLYTIGPLTEVNMLLFLRNKRFNVNFFISDYPLKSAHVTKHMFVWLLFTSALPIPPHWTHCGKYNNSPKIYTSIDWLTRNIHLLNVTVPCNVFWLTSDGHLLHSGVKFYNF